MGYEVIALDIDGTLTTTDKKLTDRTKAAISQIQQIGKTVVLASGRHDYGIYPTAKELELDKFGGYIMAFNGGKVINASSGKVMSSVKFPLEYVEPIYNYIKDTDITVMTYEGNRIIANNKVNEYTNIEPSILKMEMKVVDDFVSYVNFDVNKLLLAGEPEVIDKYQELLKEEFQGYLDIFKSAPFFLEIMPLGVNKGTSLSTLLKQLGYTRKQLIACGDSYNDMTMIGFAGLGVCMENGEKEVQKIADVIAESNDDDGVAKIIEKYMLCQG